jgi:hypothetical protein
MARTPAAVETQTERDRLPDTMLLRLAPLVAVASIAALAWAPGCASTGCTEVGCVDQVTLVFDDEVPRDYTVLVRVGLVEGTADCTAATHGDDTSEVTATVEGDLGGTVRCGTETLVYEAAPEEVSFLLTYPDGTETEVNARPAYEEQFPNGEDCGAACRTTSIDIDVHGPDGG